jgi:Flp pilus assembly protein CpaB
MSRSRTLILLGAVLLLGAVVVLIVSTQNTPPAPGPETVTTQAPQVLMTPILVAAQNIPRGTVIGSDAVIPTEWPDTNLPPSDLILSSPDQAIGKRARTDILRGEPVLQSMITEDPAELAATGYDAALSIPPGKVAVAFPIDQLSSVGYAIGPGDHVDVLVAFSVLDVNLDGQYPVIPFNRDLLDEFTAAGVPAETALNLVLQEQSKAQVPPRLLTQLTLQNIEVLYVGEWPAGGQLPQTSPAPPPQGEVAPPGTPTPVPPRPDMLILLPDQQQALILQWLREAGVSIQLALRGAGDNAPVSTDSVSYQYILTNFNITIPPKVNTVLVPLTTPSK